MLLEINKKIEMIIFQWLDIFIDEGIKILFNLDLFVLNEVICFDIIELFLCLFGLLSIISVYDDLVMYVLQLVK